jgi:hypothetical protein
MQGTDNAANVPPRRPHKAGDLRSLRARLWWALLQAEFVIATAEDHPMRLRGIHALSQIAMSYVKVHELVDLESRVMALEQALRAGGQP